MKQQQFRSTAPQEKQLLSRRDLEAMGLAKEQTLARWKMLGIGPPEIKVNGAVRYRRSDVEAWLSERTEPADSGRVRPTRNDRRGEPAS